MKNKRHITCTKTETDKYAVVSCVFQNLSIMQFCKRKKNVDFLVWTNIKYIQGGFIIAKLLQFWPPFNHLHNLHSYIPALLPGTQLLIEFIVRQATHLSFVKKTLAVEIGCLRGYSGWKVHSTISPYMLVYKDPLLAQRFLQM